jgi:PhnB protein
MAKIHTYLNFNGNCEEAFSFYQQIFKSPTMGIHRFGDMPKDPSFPIPDVAKNKIMHTAIMLNESSMLMGSDCIEGFGQKVTQGNSTYIMIDASTAEEATTLYGALSDGALTIEMKLGEQMWAELYASFQDRFGIWWIIHFEGNKQMQ